MVISEGARTTKRIVEDPEILGGKPVVKGTRISVELVLGHLAENPNLDEFFAAYPRLTLDDVKAVLAYAHQIVEGDGQSTRSPTVAGTLTRE